jgi:hypothetical protein
VGIKDAVWNLYTSGDKDKMMNCFELKHLARFMEFHFEARYPREQKKFYKKCTKEFANKKMKEMKEVFAWLRARLEKK